MGDAIPTMVWAEADDTLLSAFRKEMGIGYGEWTVQHTLHATLPLIQGGLGIPRYSLLQTSAIVGCFASCLADVLKRLLEQGYGNNAEKIWQKVSRQAWARQAETAFSRLKNDGKAVEAAPGGAVEIRFVPLVFETFGRPGKETVRFVKEMLRQSSERLGEGVDQAARLSQRVADQWWKTISVAVQRAASSTVLASVQASHGARGFKVTEILLGREYSAYVGLADRTNGGE
uniref:Uncharacterized protein n=1 Tax=Chromera velia CCMP2878 TaxID=1169474 RepID=A0A0G4I065_9ALVE|eukprot:Cvel_9870.t1-p1 / transcript=Cvel_9870.t1 / gene=Cvel_9870 / organism=Chromera_velia_CCMP2878 / gene_product=hypothetical protein / transcript_product=hypothetical protein / location=Cvel_scaffold582:2297-3760(+) / protein_length=230 / sequence_SO=supercontig / SO=protein_coding / is_pseudo=false